MIGNIKSPKPRKIFRLQLEIDKRKYSFLPSKKYCSNKYSLVPLRERDVESIRKWRNEQIDILRQNKPLTKDEQSKYYHQVIKKSFYEKKPKIILFSFLIKNNCIGYGGFVHIDWNSKKAELSIIFDTNRTKEPRIYKKEFSIFLKIILNIGFKQILFNKIFTETFDIRPPTIRILEECGFDCEGRLKSHVKIKNKYKDSLIHGLVKEEFIKKGDSINILITSVSKKIPLIKSIRKSTNKINKKIRIIGADSNKECIGKFFVDEFWNWPKLEKISVNEIISFCKTKKIIAIIPTRDGELEFFAKHKMILEKNNISVMISNKNIVRISIDKLLFYKKLNAMKLPVVKTAKKIEEIKSTKFVVKERFGSGSNKVGINLTKNKAIIHAKKLNNPIFQPYFKGTEFSVDLYVGKNRKVKGCIIRKRNLIVNGEAQISETVKNSKIERICIQIVEALKFFGHIVIQIIIDKNNQIHIIECNCRFGGASTLSIEMGLDSFYWFLLETQKIKLEKYRFIRKEINKKQIRYTTDLII